MAAPGAVDRWIAAQLAGRLDDSRVRVVLWDEPHPVDVDLEGPAALRFGDCTALRQLVVNPELNFGDLYSAGRITVHGSLMKVLGEAYRFREKSRLAGWLRRGARSITPSQADSRRNIHHHYDIGNEFYRLWLDAEALQYTCAYYADPGMTLEQAQMAKMHHVCRKIRLQPGERVVEAGSGWGGFAVFMAKHYGARVRSFNISKKQIEHSREWARRENLENRLEFVEDDFRNISGEYDAFVSIGMLEHVGTGNYRQMGKLIDRVLTPEGRGLIHTIGRDRPMRLNAWIDRRIFPGAYPPTLREMMDLFEPNGLSVLDVENIRLHYAETLRAWLGRFEKNADAVRDLFDEAFVRAWRLYLAGSVTAFERGTLQLFQVAFARTGANGIPWTRAHVYEDAPDAAGSRGA
ncbi:MAG: class I SAM-dependent methyltransferase [Xanthomonadales bacterium]|nr:cyclopropane-fatty-acyl-phospholipid synthase family protein [Gammaproteobacteria bacterium]NNK33014.1 class I SAM-dependent methyltransferase [Xanthomonadales bacterium]NNK38600.1 class I SAM-dependent methyltransferase [Xanthomonadales bacterium]